MAMHVRFSTACGGMVGASLQGAATTTLTRPPSKPPPRTWPTRRPDVRAARVAKHEPTVVAKLHIVGALHVCRHRHVGLPPRLNAKPVCCAQNGQARARLFDAEEVRVSGRRGCCRVAMRAQGAYGLSEHVGLASICRHVFADMCACLGLSVADNGASTHGLARASAQRLGSRRRMSWPCSRQRSTASRGRRRQCTT